MELEPGVMISPNVRLVKELGAGGMGSVWVADHLTLKTAVAVKFMTTELAKNETAVARFTREATAAAQIKSPHVVQIFDHGLTHENIPYIVMELLEGHDLGHEIKTRGALSLEATAAILSQTCKALSKAHEAEVVHRDIKPDNIFLTDSDGEVFVKVLDFGIAKTGASAESGMSVTSTGVMVGTPYYMSPEQMLSAKHVDFRADLWALGVVAYHCLVGDIPFRGETLGALCVAIDRCQFELPCLRNPSLPPGVDAWIRKALSREPDDRFSSAREMSEEFYHALGMGAPRSMLVSKADLSGKYQQVTVQAASAIDTNIKGAPAGPTFSGATFSTTESKKKSPNLMIAMVTMVPLALIAAGVFLIVKFSGTPESKPTSPAGNSSPSAQLTSKIEEHVPPKVEIDPRPTPSASASATAATTATATSKPIIPNHRPPTVGRTPPKPTATTPPKPKNTNEPADPGF
jgi:eukaryotic-like serine/threonine-protein kinase